MKGEFICSEINRTLLLTLHPPGKRLHEGIVFDNSTPIIPQGLSTNAKPKFSLLHYTSAESNSFQHSSPTYSDNIVVHDKVFEGNTSHELVYKPNWFSTREGDVVTGTKSDEHPRLNSFELRSILKVNNFTKLSNVNLKCSNLVNYLSINNVCKPLLKQKNDYP